MRRSFGLFLGQLLFALTFAAVASLAASASAAPPAGAQPTGPSIVELSLSDGTGKQYPLKHWQQYKAVVLFFLGTECPVSNGYAPEMQALALRFADDRVGCFGIHCDPTVTPDQAGKHAKEYGLTFPLLFDPEQTLVRATGVRVTPEAVVLSPEGKVLYRGRIDDRYATSGKRRDQPTVYDLENALRAVRAGKSPEVSETQAFGCPLPRAKQSAR